MIRPDVAVSIRFGYPRTLQFDDAAFCVTAKRRHASRLGVINVVSDGRLSLPVWPHKPTFVAAQYLSRRANRVILHRRNTASLFAITNSGYPLCRRQAIAKSRQLLEQRLRFLQIERVEAFSEPVINLG